MWLIVVQHWLQEMLFLKPAIFPKWGKLEISYDCFSLLIFTYRTKMTIGRKRHRGNVVIALKACIVPPLPYLVNLILQLSHDALGPGNRRHQHDHLEVTLYMQVSWNSKKASHVYYVRVSPPHPLKGLLYVGAPLFSFRFLPCLFRMCGSWSMWDCPHSCVNTYLLSHIFIVFMPRLWIMIPTRSRT